MGTHSYGGLQRCWSSVFLHALGTCSASEVSAYMRVSAVPAYEHVLGITALGDWGTYGAATGGCGVPLGLWAVFS